MVVFNIKDKVMFILGTCILLAVIIVFRPNWLPSLFKVLGVGVGLLFFVVLWNKAEAQRKYKAAQLLIAEDQRKNKAVQLRIDRCESIERGRVLLKFEFTPKKQTMQVHITNNNPYDIVVDTISISNFWKKKHNSIFSTDLIDLGLKLKKGEQVLTSIKYKYNKTDLYLNKDIIRMEGVLPYTFTVKTTKEGGLHYKMSVDSIYRINTPEDIYNLDTCMFNI